MTLLVLAIAYICGVWIGRVLVGMGVVSCTVSPHLWIAPLLLLCVTPFLNAQSNNPNPGNAAAPLRWPESAGFTRPPRGIARGLIVAALLCVLMGALRMVTVPRSGCWTDGVLAAWNLPSDQAFVRNAPQVTVAGYISNFPTVDDERQEVVVMASRLRRVGGDDRWYVAVGQVRLVIAARPRYHYGEAVEVTGRLATPPDFEDFSYREVLARQGIHSHFYGAQVVVREGPMQGVAWRRWLYAVRARAMTLIERMLPEPHAALAEGILLGVDAGIPDALYDRFNATGTSHVLVISGLNVTQKGWVVLLRKWFPFQCQN